MWYKSLLYSWAKTPCLVITHSSYGISAVTDRFTRASTTEMVRSAVQTERWMVLLHSSPVFSLFWHGFKAKNPGEEWKGENSNTKKKNQKTKPKLWLIINVKCQSLKLGFFHVSGWRRVRCPLRMIVSFTFESEDLGCGLASSYKYLW